MRNRLEHVLHNASYTGELFLSGEELWVSLQGGNSSWPLNRSLFDLNGCCRQCIDLQLQQATAKCSNMNQYTLHGAAGDGQL